MKKLLIISVISIFLILSGALAFYYNQNQKNKAEKIRLGNDLTQEVNSKNDVYTELILTKKELKDIKPKLDSVIRANHINSKKVEKIITYENRIKWDTIPFILHPPKADSSNLLITVAGIDNCFISEGLIDLTRTELRPTANDVENLMFSLYNTQVLDKGGIIYFQQRDTTKCLRFWPFAHLKYYSKSFSDCSSSKVEIQEINIIKK